MNEPNNLYDIAIVGAGPAGSTAAYYLGQNPKLKVRILDRSDFPRYKCCAGGLFLVDDWSAEFENFRDIRDQVNRCKCNHFDFYCNTAFFYNTADTHPFDVVDRSDFDAALLAAACRWPNVHFRRARVTGLAIDRLERNDIYVLQTEDGILHARAVIGADGFRGIISRFVDNRPLKKSDYGMCLQRDIVCDKIRPVTTTVFLNWEGELEFSWIFPNVRGYSVGLGMIGRTRRPLPRILDDFLAYAVRKQLIPDGYQKKGLKGAPCPVTMTRRFGRGRVLLCGDSLGAVRQLTGEGIYYAIKTGKLAAQCLLDGEADLLARYRAALRPVTKQIVLRRFLPFGSLHKLILKICIGIFSLRLPFQMHQKIRKRIINKFHRMDSLPRYSSYQPQ